MSQWRAEFVVGVFLRVVAFALRAEDPLYARVVIEERQEDRNNKNGVAADFMALHTLSASTKGVPFGCTVDARASDIQ